MIPMHEAQRKLISAGYIVDMQPKYRNLTILDAKYDEVKSFLTENDYMGDIIVYGRKRHENVKKAGRKDGVEQLSTEDKKIDSGDRDNSNSPCDREIYQQLELQF